jgi:uroporphyrinogen decarboxylase
MKPNMRKSPEEQVRAMSEHGQKKLFLRVLGGEAVATPPVWLMRQAGRYLPEYRAIRATAPSFLDFCYTPALAAEATLQPIRRFGFDAAILFSDILVIPDALGQKVGFESGEGPRLDPIATAEDLRKLRRDISGGRLEQVYETIDRVKGQLPEETAFIGFCGAPWTVASYMIAGRGTPDQAPARIFAYRHPEIFSELIDLLVDASAAYLIRQLKAGVEAVQIFDSWSGVLPVAEFERWCAAPVTAIVRKVRAARPEARIIAFPRGAATHMVDYARMEGISAIGLDTAVDPVWAAANVQTVLPVQGNLDPLALLAGGAGLDEAIDRILAAFRGRPHVFNLGHGILPETPIAHVEHLLGRIRT